MSVSANDYLHWVKISIKDEKYNEYPSLLWSGLPFHTRNKFDWYFKYRAALIIVNNPRFKVEITWGHKLNISLQEKERKDKVNAVRSSKALITKYTKQINEYVRNYNEIFPIEEDQRYQKAMCRLNQVKAKLIELEKHENSTKHI